jgi:hypothetical protein
VGRDRCRKRWRGPFHHYIPNIYFGKGLGDLPDTLSWIRPVAITGQVGYAIPARNFTTTFGVDPDTGNQTVDTEFRPGVLNWGGTFQYSMPYLKSAVVDLGLPEFINHLIPLVEATLQTPVANTLTSGTSAPFQRSLVRWRGSAPAPAPAASSCPESPIGSARAGR